MFLTQLVRAQPSAGTGQMGPAGVVGQSPADTRGRPKGTNPDTSQPQHLFVCARCLLYHTGRGHPIAQQRCPCIPRTSKAPQALPAASKGSGQGIENGEKKHPQDALEGKARFCSSPRCRH